jgi:GT2 family glycosyltransferase
MSKAPKIAIIIPHYDQPELLRQCLAALHAQTFPASQMQIIVGDNNSPDQSALQKLQQEFPNATFTNATEQGAGPARNAALALVKEDIDLIAFTDADCRPAPDWLTQGVKALQKSGADMVGGIVRIFCKTLDKPSAVECFEKLFAFRQRLYIEKKGFSVTANLLVTKSTADKTGLFRNGLSEDMDYCHRARALGFCLVFSSSFMVNHPARAQWAELKGKWQRLIEERWEGMREQTGNTYIRGAKWSASAVATGFSCLPHMVVVFTSSRLATNRERLKAAFVLIRIRLWRCQAMFRVMMKKTGWLERGFVKPAS